ncbi:hypothetical protein ECH_1091 [Ehrlichia chaffeensis str. Arkansas]|uniref:Uncharacterized protein n=1 Tax=Ehrlichia chaffeensis (strain ATCC CRL-10679 / Arkansas) TaxID=205920 RepID=Q2GFA7_EHRCR|nr:hypothetical protein ECH_1091 [Ehrlichia chaffeensis str. Arkansas]
MHIEGMFVENIKPRFTCVFKFEKNLIFFCKDITLST